MVPRDDRIAVGRSDSIAGKTPRPAARPCEGRAIGVDGQGRTGTPKNGERREVPVPASVLARIPLTMPEALVWPVPGTGRLRGVQRVTGWFGGAVRRIQAECDEWNDRNLDSATKKSFPKVTPHDLRHTAASLAVSAGANVKVVQRMLGHKSAAMTLDQYADLFEDDIDEVGFALDTLISDGCAHNVPTGT